MTTFVGRAVVHGQGKCEACRTPQPNLVRVVVDSLELLLCPNANVCAQRFRMGMTPEAHQRYLRGAVATLAPAR